MALAKTLKQRIKSEGFSHTLRAVAGVFINARFEIWRLSNEDFSNRSRKPSSHLIIAGAPAVQALRRRRAAVQGLPADFYRDEIDGAENCFLACVDDRPAAVAWAYDHLTPGHFLRMSSGEAEIRSVFSLAEFRGRGLATSVIAAACDSLFQRGFQNALAVIHYRNDPSRRAFASLGFRKIGELSRPPVFGPRFDTASAKCGSWGEALRGIFHR